MFFGCLQMRRNQLVVVEKRLVFAWIQSPFIFCVLYFWGTNRHVKSLWKITGNQMKLDDAPWCDKSFTVTKCVTVTWLPRSLLWQDPQSMAYVRRHIIPIINQKKCTISFSCNRRRAASMTLSVPKDWPSSPQIAGINFEIDSSSDRG